MHKKPSENDAPVPADNTGKLKIARIISLLAYAFTLLLGLNWISWYSPPTEVPRALILLILVVPLVFPVRGFMHGRGASHVGMAAVSMWLFVAGLDIAFYRQNWTNFGWGLVGGSTVLFIACFFYLRYLPRPDKVAEESSEPTEEA